MGRFDNMRFSSSEDEWYLSSDDEEYAGDDCGLSLEKLNIGPRKKLLVLGLGGLLCHRVHRRVWSMTRYGKSDVSYGSFFVYKRPYCEEFMEFCLENFEVGIWSSAREWNLDSALDSIMEGLKSKLVFAWDQDECTDSGFKTLENQRKPVFLKELKKLEKLRIQYSATNTLLIDGNPYKALLNPPHTAIFPNEYETDQVGDDSLGPRGDLRLYLEGLSDADDVPSYVKLRSSFWAACNNPYSLLLGFLFRNYSPFTGGLSYLKDHKQICFRGFSHRAALGKKSYLSLFYVEIS